MRAARGRARGFSLIELMLASLLMAMVLGMLANAWVAFGRPAVNAVARCRVAQEANLAAEALADDFGTMAASPADPQDGRYGTIQPGDDGVSFSFERDDGKGTITTVIYTWDASKANLVRSGSGQARVVATLVTGLQVTPSTVASSMAIVPGVQIQLTFTHATNDRIDGDFCNQYTRQYTLFVPGP